MLVEERRQKLSDIVSRRGYVPLPELVVEMGVSESTVRRDLEVLHEAGVLRRTHGGATAAGDSSPLLAFEERSGKQQAEKRKIAAKVTQLVADGETILLDGGTTTFEVARQLVGRSLVVVTNSLPIASLLASSKETDVILIGGFVYPKTGVALGPIALKAIESLHVDRLIMSVGGLTQRGMFNGNMLLVETEQAMIRAADEFTVLADHTKFGKQALAFLHDWSVVDRIIVDDQVTQEGLAMVGPDVEVMIAQ